tara:strand:- start:140 stop:1732 length:1593 start_codon:yes stop_codon:yes gene_type:complete
MSNNILATNIISLDSYNRINNFARTNPRINQITDFLFSEFSISSTNDPKIVKRFEKDASNIVGKAEALCRPSNEKECALILCTLNKLSIEVTISAGRTSLTGGATPNRGFVISMEQMNKPKPQVNVSLKTVISPVGIYLENMRNEVLIQSDNSLYYPVDPTSRKEATIGGTVSCNASGFTPGPKGATRYWTSYLEFLTADGHKISCNRGQYISKNGEFSISTSTKSFILKVPTYSRPKIKNASGPFSDESGEMDLVDFIVGSEGIYGLITLVGFKLDDKPKDFLDIYFTLSSEEASIKFYNYIKDKLDNDLSKLTAFEYFGHNCQSYMDFSEDFFKNNSDTGIYIQVPIYSKSVDKVSEFWFETLVNSGCDINVDEIIIFSSTSHRKKFFNSRHSIPINAWERSTKLGTPNIMTDTIVPSENFGKFLKLAHQSLEEADIEYVLFGHLGDCHLHFHFMPTVDQVILATKIYENLVEISANLGGVYSAEHGTGKRKLKDFKKCFGNKGVEQIKISKIGIDSNYILNKGNIIA